MALHTQLIWKDGLHFEAITRDHHMFMDAKKDSGGKNRGPNPKEFVLMGLCGCTGMDVMSLVKKFQLPIDSFVINAEAPMTQSGHPVVFEKILIIYEAKGTKVDKELLIKAVHLSMTKYCGVTAMLSKACPVEYKVRLNDEEIHTDIAKF